MKSKWFLPVIFLILFFPLWLFAQDLQVHFIDVGEGDSILIVSPQHHTVLIDSGSRKAGNKVGDYLRSQKIKGLNLVIATHCHEDHIGGFKNLIGKFYFALLIEPGFGSRTQTYSGLLNEIQENDIKYKTARAGQTYQIDPDILLTILAPEEPLISHSRSDANNSSVVARLTYRDIHFLFMGDAEREAEDRLIKKNLDLESEVLKVGHHGSKYSTSISFLDRVKPKIAVISVGPNNYGHPFQLILDRLMKRKVKVYRTDENEDIIVDTDGKKINVIVGKTSLSEKQKKKLN